MRVERFQIVLATSEDSEIVLSRGAQIKKLRDWLEGELLDLETPVDAGPDVPRVIVRSTDVIFLLSPSRIEFQVKPHEDLEGDIEEACKSVLSTLREVLKTWGEVHGYEWSGIVLHIQFPDAAVGSPLSSVTPLFDRLIDVDRADRPLAQFNLGYGFTVDGLHRNYTLTGYQKHEFKMLRQVQVPAGKHRVRVPVDPTSGESVVQESGIQLMLDVNNKPSDVHAGPSADIEALLSVVPSELAALRVELGV